MSENIRLTLNPAEQNIVRQALRAERDRMMKQGFHQLAYVADTALTKVSDAVLDNNLIKG